MNQRLEVEEHAQLNGKWGSKFSIAVENDEAHLFSVKISHDREPWLEEIGKICLFHWSYQILLFCLFRIS